LENETKIVKMSTTYNVEAAVYPIPATRQGDTWRGLTLQFDEDITGWRFRMWVEKQPTGKAVIKYDSNEGNPVITDAANGIVVWAPEIMALSPGSYKYDIEVIRPDDSVSTYITGDWPILNQVTK